MISIPKFISKKFVVLKNIIAKINVEKVNPNANQYEDRMKYNE
jgi:hypothetical protein